MLKLVRRLPLTVSLSCAMAGCATAPTLTPAQQATEALVVSNISLNTQTTCDAGGTPGGGGCLFLGYVDGKATSLASPNLAITAGVHTISTTYSPTGMIQFLPRRPLVFPAFDYKPGHRYVLTPQAIYDTELNDPGHRIIATYVMYNGRFEDRNLAMAQDLAAAQAAQRAFRLQQQRDMPRIQKVGAEVCMHATDGIAHGYVEGVADQKIKIRIDHVGHFQASPQGDRVVWDFPDQWYLCGSN